MLKAIANVNKWKRLILSQHDAEEQAKLQYMTKTEQQIWQKYFEALGQQKRLEDFLKTLKKPDESDREAMSAYEQVVAGVKSKIYISFTNSLTLKKAVEEIASKL